MLLEAVTDDDLYDLARTLVERGKSGDVMAAREILDRMLGKSKATVMLEPPEAVVFGPVTFSGGRRVVEDTRRSGVEDAGDPGAGPPCCAKHE